MAVRSAFERSRGHLNDWLFLAAPPDPPVTLRRALVCAAIAAVATAIQLLRMWSSLPLDSLWAEDGGVWLGVARNGELLDALTTPHNGYLQATSRLVAASVAELPLEWYPAGMAIAGAGIVTGCAFLVWRVSAAHIQTPYLRAALAAMVILLGAAGTETLANVTNSIWFLLFACFWLLLWRPAKFATAAGAAALVFLVAVTTIGALFLFPLWLLRLIAVRGRRDVVILVAFAAGVAVQLAFSWNDLGLGPEGPVFNPIPAGLEGSSRAYWDWELVPAFAQRVVGGATMGQPVNAYLWTQLGAVYAIVLGVGAIALVAGGLAIRHTRILVPLAVATALALFLASGYQRWGTGGLFLFWPDGESSREGTRYLITPILLMFSALFVWLDAAPRGASGRDVPPAGWVAIQAASTVFVLFCALASFSIGDRVTRGALPWSESLAAGRAECQAGDPTEVLILLNHPPLDAFSLPLPCSDLEETGS